MYEKQIERKVCEFAKKNGVLHYKFTSPSRTAVPDRMFINQYGKVWFCEFKRTGFLPTPAQLREHAKLEAHNVTVYVVDNVPDGMTMIETMKEVRGC